MLRGEVIPDRDFIGLRAGLAGFVYPDDLAIDDAIGFDAGHEEVPIRQVLGQGTDVGAETEHHDGAEEERPYRTCCFGWNT